MLDLDGLVPLLMPMFSTIRSKSIIFRRMTPDDALSASSISISVVSFVLLVNAGVLVIPLAVLWFIIQHVHADASLEASLEST